MTKEIQKPWALAALLGNALLLGSLKEFGKSPQASLGAVEIEKALIASGLIDPDLARMLGHDAYLQIGARETCACIEDAVANRPDLARITISDVIALAKSCNFGALRAALQELPGHEPIQSIVRLPVSKEASDVVAVLVAALLEKAASDLGISSAAIRFIGSDGLLACREARLHKDNLPALSQQEQERLAGIFNNYVVEPIKRRFDRSERHTDLQDLYDRFPDPHSLFDDKRSPFCESLDDLFDRLNAEAGRLPTRDIEMLFPSWRAADDMRNYRAEADPQNFYLYAVSAFGWYAVFKGWAVAIAQDDHGPRLFRWVTDCPKPPVPEDGSIPLPLDVGVENLSELGFRLSDAVGAARLHFATVADVSAFLNGGNAASANSSQSRRSNKTNSGFNETDAPYVDEGVKMVKEGEVTSANAAAAALIKRYGQVLVSDYEPGSKAIRTYSFDATHGRLQKKISKELRRLDLTLQTSRNNAKRPE